MNTYGFVRERPLTDRDPLGLFVFGTRPLAGGVYFPTGLNNDNAWHENGFFDNGNNVGYFPGGIQPDSPSNYPQYQMYGPFYDDNIMQQALQNLQNSGNWLPAMGGPLDDLLHPNPWGYDVFKRNCQDFASALRREYKRLGGTTCQNAFVNGVCTAPSY